MSYTAEQEESLRLAKRRLSSTGKPEVVAQLDLMMELDTPYEKVWAVARADVEGMVKPEKAAEAIPHPPITGKGSTTAAWQKFAKAVSDMEPEVIMSMGRNDLIRVLGDRGIIEVPDELFGDA